MENNLETLLQNSIDRNLNEEQKKQISSYTNANLHNTFWKSCPLALENIERCLYLLSKLTKVRSLQHVMGAGIKIPIQTMDLQYLWFKLLPLCLKIESVQKGNRILIGYGEQNS